MLGLKQARHLVNFLDSNNTDEIEYVELDDALKHVRRLHVPTYIHTHLFKNRPDTCVL